jgi:RNA ligase
VSDLRTTVGVVIDEVELATAIQRGHIRKGSHPAEPLSILSYTDRCVYERGWNRTTRACRGLIVHDDGSIIARPWGKFFNYGEPDAPLLDLASPAEVVDKVDGSLGILYPTSGGWQIATRGSFVSDQAIHATALLRDRYPDFTPPAGLTVLVEIVYPENRIVCDYGDRDDLILLGAVRISDGKAFGPNDVQGWPGPRAEVQPAVTIADALALPPRPGAEGVVVRVGDEMVKIKQEDYLRLHRIISGLSALSIWEALGSGDTVARICEPLPDEFHQWVRDIADGLTGELGRIQVEALVEHNRILKSLGGGPDRKAYAAIASRSPLRAWLFMLLDRKDPGPKIWQTLKPRGDVRPTSMAEGAE